MQTRFFMRVVFGIRAGCRMRILCVSCASILFSCTPPHLYLLSVSLSLSGRYYLSLCLPLSFSLCHSTKHPFRATLEGHPLPRTACPRIRPGVAVSSRAASARASLAIVGPRVHKTGRFSSSSAPSPADVYAWISQADRKELRDLMRQK